MKNKCNESSMLYAAVLVTAIITLAACKHEAGKPKPKTYAVTMEYDAATGTASASPNPAAKGQAVTVTAEAAGNYKFKLWELVSGDAVLSSFIANPALFTMPDGPVTIRAEFTALADIILDEVTYGYEQPAKRNIAINALGLDTQTVSGIAMAGGEESPFELDTADINNKIAVGNVLGFYVQPKIGLKTGSHSDAVNITHGGGKTAVFSIMITVNPKPVTVSGLTAENKEYDGTVDAVISGTPVLEGLVDGDYVELREGTAVFEDQNAGEAKNILLSSYRLRGPDADNYTLPPMQGLTANIVPKPVTVIVTDHPLNILMPFGTANAAYLGNTYRKNTVVGVTVSGFIPGETVSIHVSENSYGLSGSADSGESGTITVEYDGTEVSQTAAVQAALEAAGNYRLEALNNPLFNVCINDGLAEDRWIPVAKANISEFNAFASSAKGLNRHYRLVEDIMLPMLAAGESNWVSIGTVASGFTGSFDGNGYYIYKLTISNNSSNQGMFGVVGTEGLIRNATLFDSSISGLDNIGGLAGINLGIIENSFVEGNVSGSNYIGGVAGGNYGTVQNCYTTSGVTGLRYVGGIAGIISGVPAGIGTMLYCYASGTISGNENAGGLAGFLSNGASIRNCVALNDKVMSESNNASGGRVLGADPSPNIISNNYARRDLNINKPIAINYLNNDTIDGADISSKQYGNTTWWTDSSVWDGDAWDFSTVWIMNVYNLPKLRTAYANQNHKLSASHKMVWINSGSFIMGSPENEDGRNEDEGPQHIVNMSGFYIGTYAVTRNQYNLLMGGSTDYSLLPISTSWYYALMFCNFLSITEGFSPAYSINNSTDPTEWGYVPTWSNAEWNAVEIVSGSDGYRLPTEAQWEYACRAGTTTVYASGNDNNDNMCWHFFTSYLQGQQEVGLKQPNAWGLYDMHGNINEWCWDWYGPYTGNTQNDPMGPLSGTNRVNRGGNSFNFQNDVRSASRFYNVPQYNQDDLRGGIRLVRP
ncbi:MAG: SUMF1/EgtB/PvdO family nonheme iron enzyme [Treponema sp.]|nr:SUMF1/EgtB/PvdO family nonheme iron enzyme [Treponema sp.]